VLLAAEHLQSISLKLALDKVEWLIIAQRTSGFAYCTVEVGILPRNTVADWFER